MAATLQRQGRSRRGGRGRRRSAPMAEINVTPFVDVMLVLLIIFMVAAPLLTVGVPLELPRTAAVALPSEPEEPLVISLTDDGQLLLMDEQVSEADLIARLQAVLAERDTAKIFLRADRELAYGRVVQVMGALNGAGFTDIVLVTETGGPEMNG
ncbi:ExbD/TolR family protein [Paracoccus sp. TK19116]|uniref:ExbD/TolR family protein n=1 Tax=Paracoccus albicereus TaxID=2922394 RepID=A0ABT1MQF6_9RHOB|nr:ExbD/TolR family protein [Paracoccus albicereus]MCQ0970544.1 ExbD/TolR family protein [Paracoccus albicereus]